jgi:cytochrome c biogenesis protein CcmG, thiol:disulfide interchange protein DsbE
MKAKILFIILSTVLVVGCSNNTTVRGSFIENNATNYLMPKCPNSDLTVIKPKNQIAPAVLECLGHDEFVNLAGLPDDRPLVISFWASWCTVCADDAVSFNAAFKKLSSQVNFLGIAYQDEEKKSIAAAYKWQLPFPSVQDPRSFLREFYAINGLPVTLLINKDGEIIERIAGPIGSPEDFTNRVSGKLISY